MGKRHVIDAYQKRHERVFIFPEINTIEDFVSSVWIKGTEPPQEFGPYRGDRTISPLRDFYFLEGEDVDHEPIYIKAKKEYGRGIARHCSNNKIGGYKVFKGAWPDPYALLLANDEYHISAPFISLIDWNGYQEWLDEQIESR